VWAIKVNTYNNSITPQQFRRHRDSNPGPLAPLSTRAVRERLPRANCRSTYSVSYQSYGSVSSSHLTTTAYSGTQHRHKVFSSILFSLLQHFNHTDQFLQAILQHPPHAWSSSLIRRNSEKCHITCRPTTSDTVTPTSHNLHVWLSCFRKAVVELHPSARFGSKPLGWV